MESHADKAASAVVPDGRKEDRPVSGGSRSRLLGEARRARILAWLQEEGSARVRTLAEAFDVSEVTMRQDL